MIFLRHINFFLCIVFLCSFNVNSQEIDNDYVVVIDPGHGGKDPGNRGNGYYEKNIVLNIALNVGSDLTKNNKNLKVIYTRKDDRFIDLYKRAQIANNANADLFISIHCDAHNSNAYGAGTFVLGLHANERNFKIAQKENSVIFLEEDYEEKYDGFDPNNPESVISLVLMQEEYLDQSIIAADYIQDFLVKDLNRKDRKVKQAGFVVLRNTYMPSVLVETGFLTNKIEGKYLNSSKGQKEIAKSISNGIVKYLGTIDAKKLNYNSIINTTKGTFKGDNNYIFKIQISASSKLLPLKSYNFKGLNNLSTINSNGLIKYYYGNTKSYKEAKKLLNKAIKAGFKSSFISVFKDGGLYDLKKYLSEFE